jgi:hypothetical protein
MIERGREDVLAGVLLAMIAPACGIDDTMDLLADLQRRVGDVLHLSAVVGDIEDANATKRARVERLAAGGGIKRRAIEHDAPTLIITFNDAGYRRVELEAVGIGVVDAHQCGSHRVGASAGSGTPASAKPLARS